MTFYTVVVIALQLLSVALADLSDEPANCTLSGWDWASNSLGQNPCVVAGLLEAPCRNESTYYLPQLNGTDVYLPPKATDAPQCECNTVIYSLFQACTACQNHTITTWLGWDAGCPSVYVSQYPGIIPAVTRVPSWAYMNVTVDGTWVAASAQLIGDSPESTNTPIPTASVPASSSTSFSSSGTPNISPDPSPSPTTSQASSAKSSSHVGPIVGGVIGGVAVLSLIVGLIIWYLLRQRRAQPTITPAYPSGVSSLAQPYSPGAYEEPMMKFYSPNDPTTFPPNTDNLPSLHTSGSASANYPRGAYNGAPEL